MDAPIWRQKEALKWAIKQARSRRNDSTRHYASTFTIEQEEQNFQALEEMLADLNARHPATVRVPLTELPGRTLVGESHAVDRIYCTEGKWRWCAESTTSPQMPVPFTDDGTVLVLAAPS